MHWQSALPSHWQSRGHLTPGERIQGGYVVKRVARGHFWLGQ